MKKPHLVFTSLAQNQTEFFVAIGSELQTAGYEVSIVSFHEPSFNSIAEAGLNGYNVFEMARRHDTSDSESLADKFNRLLKKYSLPTVGLLLSHEKASFLVTDTNQLKRKLCRYLEAVEECYESISRMTDRKIVTVQETGGFLSLIATFYVSRRREIPHYFIEPAFYRGRLFFSRDTFAAPKVRARSTDVLSDETRSYIEKTKASGQIVVPKKDAWQYQGAFKKIVTTRNVRRLYEKSMQKFVLGQEEEFSHIGQYVGKHMKMLTAPVTMRQYYSAIPEQPFLYYPFHVPMDVALTVRSPAFLDQLALVDYIARSAPANHLVAVKEHPALVGAIAPAKLKDLLRRNDNVVLLNPQLGNFDVMRKAKTVVTVNSKSGAEAFLCGTNVVVFGDGFYTDYQDIRYVKDVRDLPTMLQEAATTPFSAPNLDSFLAAMWNQSLPGDLYSNDAENVTTFAKTIDELIVAPEKYIR